MKDTDPHAASEAPDVGPTGASSAPPTPTPTSASLDLERIEVGELKKRSAADLLELAQTLEIGNAGSMRKQALMFEILRALDARGVEIAGVGVIETLQDGFGFMRSPDSNYLPGPDDVYVAPTTIRRFSLRTGDNPRGSDSRAQGGRALLFARSVDVGEF